MSRAFVYCGVEESTSAAEAAGLGFPRGTAEAVPFPDSQAGIGKASTDEDHSGIQITLEPALHAARLASDLRKPIRGDWEAVGSETRSR
jgi:hypothetical protein